MQPTGIDQFMHNGLPQLRCDSGLAPVAFRPRRSYRLQEAPFLADAPAGSPTNLSVFEAWLEGNVGALIIRIGVWGFLTVTL